MTGAKFVSGWKCPICGKIHNSQSRAEDCCKIKSEVYVGKYKNNAYLGDV